MNERLPYAQCDCGETFQVLVADAKDWDPAATLAELATHASDCPRAHDRKKVPRSGETVSLFENVTATFEKEGWTLPPEAAKKAKKVKS